ncbi:hypothetical protein MRB53_038752 [Persea americana]|nr:hypothetical protein MRB53_038752 [Persea americana]
MTLHHSPEHHARTPETFFAAQPVLHLHLPDAKVTSTVAVLKEHATVFNAISTATVSELEPSSAVEIENIDVWVTSK